MSIEKFIPWKAYREYPAEEMQQRADNYYQEMSRRRTIRAFSKRPVAQELIETCIRTAGTAPSGANMQPWYFAAVGNPSLKKEIRIAAEQEEFAFYHGRASRSWLDDLRPFATDEHKPFLEQAPWLIAVFEQRYAIDADGNKHKNYYVSESVGIATGLLISALHHAGLAVLTHTPSPMKFLNQILKRPANEKPFLLIVCGYPAADVKVPDNKRKKDAALFSVV